VQEQKYPLKSAFAVTAPGIFFCALFAIVFAYSALTNHRGLIINYGLQFTASQATVIYWMLMGVCLVAVGAFISLAWNYPSDGSIRVTIDRLIVPQSKGSLEIPFASIRKINLRVWSTRMRSQRKYKRLEILHARGTTFINQSHLKEKASFDDLYAQLQNVFRPGAR